jgi:hypothetical protein
MEGVGVSWRRPAHLVKGGIGLKPHTSRLPELHHRQAHPAVRLRSGRCLGSVQSLRVHEPDCGFFIRIRTGEVSYWERIERKAQETCSDCPGAAMEVGSNGASRRFFFSRETRYRRSGATLHAMGLLPAPLPTAPRAR